jgi:hypothetical protein
LGEGTISKLLWLLLLDMVNVDHKARRWLVGEIFDGVDDGNFGHFISWRFLEAQGK